MLTFGSTKREKYCYVQYLASLGKAAQLKYLPIWFFLRISNRSVFEFSLIQRC